MLYDFPKMWRLFEKANHRELTIEEKKFLESQFPYLEAVRFELLDVESYDEADVAFADQQTVHKLVGGLIWPGLI